MASHDHSLVFKLASYISWSRAGDFDPGLGEECTGCEHECDVNRGVDGIYESFLDGVGRGHVVGDSRDGRELGRVLEGLYMNQGHSTTISISR